MAYEMILVGGGAIRRRYRQGRGGRLMRRYRQGRGRKMQAFKRFAKKGLNFTRRHVLPHLPNIGSNVLMDVMDGKNVGQSIKSNARQHARNELR